MVLVVDLQYDTVTVGALDLVCGWGMGNGVDGLFVMAGHIVIECGDVETRRFGGTWWSGGASFIYTRFLIVTLRCVIAASPFWEGASA